MLHIRLILLVDYMDLMTLHRERQEQLNLSATYAYQALRVSYEAQKIELIDYKNKANFFETQFKKSDEKKQALQAEVEALKAKLAQREQQLFGKKSERRHKPSDKNVTKPPSKNPRGQQRGSKGHGRRDNSHLPEIEETYDLPEDEKHCPCCQLPYQALSQTEDSSIIEIINVQAYQRKIHRKKYKRGCQCKATPSFIDAPIPPRLLPKNPYGLSIWAHLLLQKYEYHQPINRVLKHLDSNGLSLPAGTVIDGFSRLLPLLLPVYEAFVAHSLSESHWHADETRWKVFEPVEGKKNQRWYMWLFQSKETVIYKICKSRSSQELIDYFGEEHSGGLLNVDRYSAYKCIAKNGSFLLAFCWAHVRRDFLSHARGYPEQEAWALSWVEQIATLYHINNQRLTYKQKSKKYRESQRKLDSVIEEMRSLLDSELASNELLPSAKKLMKSLDAHWDGLTLFVDDPNIPMDNNKAENSIRHGVIGRNGYYGSGAVWSSALTAVMFSLFRTCSLWKINPHTWLLNYFQECAVHGGVPPGRSIKKFLPWKMSKEQKAKWAEPPVGETPIQL